MPAALPVLAATDLPPIRRRLETLQVHLGYRGNQSGLRCHVAANPQRTEAMAADTVALLLKVLRDRRIGTLDPTGDARAEPALPWCGPGAFLAPWRAP